MKKSSDTIGNRTRDLPVCIIVSQPLRRRVLHGQQNIKYYLLFACLEHVLVKLNLFPYWTKLLPEDVGMKFLRNTGSHLPGDPLSYPSRTNCDFILRPELPNAFQYLAFVPAVGQDLYICGADCHVTAYP
jgi:hypothetical protein